MKENCRQVLLFNHAVRQIIILAIRPIQEQFEMRKKNGIEINHLGRQLSENDLDSFDYIVAMDASNLRNIFRLERAMENSHKIFLMRSHDPFGKDQDVPDPYYGEEKDFQEVFEILDRSIDQLIIQLRSSES